MTKPNNFLIITTTRDPSLPLFFLQTPKNIRIDVFLFEENLDSFQTLKEKLSIYEYVYIRDPFNSESVRDLSNKTKFVTDNLSSQIISVDQIRSADDLLIEDKWLQYQKFSEFLPHTEILSSKSSFNPNTQFIKKRISSRAKGIVFNLDQITNHENYIIQEKIAIQEEYRIYSVYDKIIHPAVFKNSKTQSTAVKIDRTRSKSITPELKKFVGAIHKKTKLDLIGFDIALTKQNQFKLIEINRSPQFATFFEVTKINLANLLLSAMIKN